VRVVGAVARVLGAVAVAIIVAAGVVRLREWLLTSPRFAVREIVFTGQDRVATEELSRRAGLVRGMNVFQVDLAAAAHAMEEDPRVAHARVARDLPDTLRVAVDEHRAVALVLLGAVYAAAADGTVFKRATPSDGYDLPMITGLSRETFAGEHLAADDGLRAALALAEAYGRLGLDARAPLSEVHVERVGSETLLTAWCGDEPLRVDLGALASSELREPGPVLEARLARLARVWDELQRRGARARSVDVGNRTRPDWVAARLDSAEPSPAARGK